MGTGQVETREMVYGDIDRNVLRDRAWNSLMEKNQEKIFNEVKCKFGKKAHDLKTSNYWLLAFFLVFLICFIAHAIYVEKQSEMLKESLGELIKRNIELVQIVNEENQQKIEDITRKYGLFEKDLNGYINSVDPSTIVFSVFLGLFFLVAIILCCWYL